MPKRNKLSQRRLEYKRKQKAWMVQQRQKAWMVHQMIDEDLKNLTPYCYDGASSTIITNNVAKEENDEVQEKETQKENIETN